jgi:7,8-didemethyl-8-hydroxy-5-deazariboflavin synthase CofG subunit
MPMTREEAYARGRACDNELEEMRAAASTARDRYWGRAISYSRKVFIPLTTMCRNTCGYCTFVKHPSQPGAKYMTPDEVLDVARRGEHLGCKEALFSLGEKPELRYPEAKAALAKFGFASTIDYLTAMCELVLERTQLIPHVNAGTLNDAELSQLKPFSASMGMMLETASRRLMQPGMAHHACPDKLPIQRLRTLEAAGRAKVPFTTGILIGIGETWNERIDSLFAIDDIHREYGHIQEVIVQNFRAKSGTAMAHVSEPAQVEMLRTLAVARLILDSSISLQAPPNLEQSYQDYIASGINDWGGVSPLTVDHINPERAWPALAELSHHTAACGYRLVERLTVYPTHMMREAGADLGTIADAVARLAGADGLARMQSLA